MKIVTTQVTHSTKHSYK